MDRLIALVEALTYPMVYVVVIILFFLFVIKPLLNYFVMTREIEFNKKVAKELEEEWQKHHEEIEDQKAEREMEYAAPKPTAGMGAKISPDPTDSEDQQ